MSDTPAKSLLNKLKSLELSEAESRLLHTIFANGGTERAPEDEVEGFASAESLSLNFTKITFDPARLRRIGQVDDCDDEPTISCFLAVTR